MICVKDGRSTLLCKGKGVEKSESVSCSLTTHLHVAGNFGSRGRALCGFSTVSFSLSLSFSSPSSTASSTSIVRGCSEDASRAGRKRILKQGGNCLSFSRGGNFLADLRRVSCVSEAKRWRRREIVGCIAGCVVRVMSGINLGLIIKTKELVCKNEWW